MPWPMARSNHSQSWDFEVSDHFGGGILLRLQGRMDAAAAAPMLHRLVPLVEGRSVRSLVIDLGGVTYFDDFGVLVLVELRDVMTKQSGEFALENVSQKTGEILSILNFDAMQEGAPLAGKRAPSVFSRLGDDALKHLGELRFLISFAGSVFLAFSYVLFHPRSLRKDDTLLYMQRTGVDALPIVGLISFLLGLIIAFMSSVQLEQFGANIYVASLVSLAMTRELGPIMTAIIVAGRTGSSFAAELGTMKVSEEVDALFTMGFDPTRFLVIPKLLASVFVVPFLTLFSDLFGIAGGLLVGVSMLDLTADAFIAKTVDTLTLFDVYWGLLKSAIFALLIAWLGCFRGFRVTGGAASVGQATTSAVVSSIFMIILTDSVFAVVLRYWG
jgi:phospholipid/cholesterol/gamma-HCH transport system permease protein